MGDVIDIGGTTTLGVPVEKVLDSCKDMEEVIVIGWREDSLCYHASNGSIPDALMLLELVKKSLLEQVS